MILDRKINFDQIMFTDECIIDLSAYTNDSIRLDPMAKERLKNGEREMYELVNRPIRKFEKSLMIAGGISYYGLSDLMIMKGTINDFQYAQTLFNYKKNIDYLNEKYNCNLIFQQDGARAHTSKNNMNLINKFFKDNYLQNPPNRPDLAYPIENIWTYLKKWLKIKSQKHWMN